MESIFLLLLGYRICKGIKCYKAWKRAQEVNMKSLLLYSQILKATT